LKKTILILLAAVLALSAAAGCNIDNNDPGIDPQTLKPATAEPSPTDAEPTASPVVTKAPETETPTEEPTPEPTEIITPEPTEVPTERPGIDTLNFKSYLDKESGSVRDLCYFSDDAEPGYKENVLANIFDGDDRTYWSVLNNDLDLTLDLNFSVPVYINRLDNWWYTLNKIYFYKVAVKLAGSEEFIEVVDRSKKSISDETTDNINIGPVEVVRYYFYDNNMLNKWVQFAELYIRGVTFTSETFQIDFVNKTVRIPEAMSDEQFLENIRFIGTYRVWIGFEPDNAGLVTDSSVLRIGCKDVKDDFMIEYIR
jgi:hypothetical protein